jgi:hypothetical protein
MGGEAYYARQGARVRKVPMHQPGYAPLAPSERTSPASGWSAGLAAAIGESSGLETRRLQLGTAPRLGYRGLDARDLQVPGVEHHLRIRPLAQTCLAWIDREKCLGADPCRLDRSEDLCGRPDGFKTGNQDLDE